MNSHPKAYTSLLAPSYSEFMPAFRVDSWARIYDGKASGLFDILDASRLNGGPTSTSPTFIGSLGLFTVFAAASNSSSSANTSPWQSMDEETKEKSDLTNARAFVDQIDGINLDLDRLLGYQADTKTEAIEVFVSKNIERHSVSMIFKKLIRFVSCRSKKTV